LLTGARQAGLDPEYVLKLEDHQVYQPEDHPVFKPPSGDYPAYDAASLARRPLHTSLYGAVFDMSRARPLHDYLKQYFGGRDMTLFHLKRMDSSDGTESMDDIRYGRLNKAQQRYLNGYLNEYAREYRYLGRFNYD
jgi:sulfite reductase (NADPH) flavoprotein alpha-component